jgi:hypothetical protein
MKYAIEIVRFGDAAEVEVLHRSEIQAIGPKWAKSQAERLLDAWRPRSANGVVIRDGDEKQVFNWRD